MMRFISATACVVVAIGSSGRAPRAPKAISTETLPFAEYAGEPFEPTLDGQVRARCSTPSGRFLLVATAGEYVWIHHVALLAGATAAYERDSGTLCYVMTRYGEFHPRVTHYGHPPAAQPKDEEFKQLCESESVMAKNMQPYPKREFARGAPIRPTEGLVAWLDANKSADTKRVLRVPVMTTFDRISIKEAKIGDLPVRVHDSALGVSFLERANQYGKDSGGRCVLSLIGYWRGGTEGLFDVIQVEGLAPEDAAHAEVEVTK